MAVVGPSRHTRVSMSLMQGSSTTGSNNTGNNNSNTNGTSNTNSVGNNCNNNSSSNSSSNSNQQSVLSAPQNYYHTQPTHQPSNNIAQSHHFPSDVQADRPIGYGAFGVVW